MAGLLVDTDEPAVLASPQFDGCLVATYADILTTELIAGYGPRLVVIDRGLGDPHHMATVADVEPGALSIAQAAERVKVWNAAGVAFPTVYHDRAIDAEMTAALGTERCFRWIATLDGTLVPDVPRHDVVQFAGAATVGLHADLSIVWNLAWHPQAAGPTAGAIRQVKIVADAIAKQANALEAAARAL